MTLKAMAAIAEGCKVSLKDLIPDNEFESVTPVSVLALISELAEALLAHQKEFSDVKVHVRATRSEEAPNSWPWLLHCLVAAVVCPFDRVLAGMVGAGLGIAATFPPRRQARRPSGETPSTDSGTASAGGTPSSMPVRNGAPVSGASGWIMISTLACGPRSVTWTLRLKSKRPPPETSRKVRGFGAP